MEDCPASVVRSGQKLPLVNFRFAPHKRGCAVDAEYPQIQGGRQAPVKDLAGQSSSDVARRLCRQPRPLLEIHPEHVRHPRPAHLHGPAVESSPIASLNRKGAIWLRPGLRAGVRYLRGEGLLRHGSVTDLTIDPTD